MKDQQPGRETESLLTEAATALQGLFRGDILARSLEMPPEQTRGRWQFAQKWHPAFAQQLGDVRTMLDAIDEVRSDKHGAIVLAAIGFEFHQLQDPLAARFLGDILYTRTFEKNRYIEHEDYREGIPRSQILKEQEKLLQSELGLSDDFTSEKAKHVTFNEVAKAVLLGRVRLKSSPPEEEVNTL